MTVRRDTEREQVKEARELLAAIVETSGDAIISRTLDGTVLSWNAGAEKMFGHTAAEMIGRSISCIAPPERQHESHHNTWLLQQGRPVPSFETVRIARDGRPVHVQISVSAIRDGAGNVTRVAAIFRDIGKRKQVEQARANLAAIVENANDAIISRTHDGTILSWNAAAERLFGYSAAEAIGRPIEELIQLPEVRARIAQNAERVRRGEAVAPYETRRKTKDGRVIDVLSSVSPIRNDAGEIIAASIILHGISALKQAEAAAKESDERFRAMFEQAGVGMGLRDIDPRKPHWLRVNQKLCDILGYTREELLELSSVDVTPPGERQTAIDFNEKLLRGEIASYSREKRYVRKDGRTIWANINLTAVNGPDGRPVHVISVIQDITERMEAEKHARLSAAVFENSNEGIIVTDASNNIISVNPAFTRITGYTPGEVIGKSPSLLSSGMQDKAFYQALWASIHATGRWQGELWDRRKNGEIYCEQLSISTVKNPQGETVHHTAIFTDITERKRAERELQLKAALTQLLESLARAVNEAATPEQAMQVCLERICDYGGWTLARVGTFAPGQRQGVPQSSLWHCRLPARFDGFIGISNRYNYSGRTSGQFVSAALRERKPVWVSDFSTTPGFGRLADAVKCGIRAGFVFPVVVGDEALAFFEFFADEVRAPDALFLEAIATIGSQLARVIERKRALDEARASEQKLDSILDALHEVVWSMDLKSGRLLYLNAAAQRLARRPVSDFLADARLWRRMIHREDRAQVLGSARKLLADGSLTHEFRIVLADGEARVVESRAHVVRDTEGGVQRIDGTMTDITERKQAEARSDYLAQHDTVTGLPNRRLFNDRLTLALARDKRLGAMTALLLLDLDRFKQINESLGHGAGDLVLQTVSARLKERLREVDTIARLGGDEFAVILEGVTGKEQALHVAEKIVEAMAEPLQIGCEEIFVTASVGVATSPDATDGAENLIENAELAMYQAKQDGRNTLQSYVPDKKPRRSTGLGLESKLRRAIERDELLLHFQPKVDIRSGAVTGAEALVRWRNPELGLVPPLDFIPLAEETGLIMPIGEWVLHSACAQASAWRRQGYPLAVAVNLSARQFRQKNLCDMVALALADSGLPAESLELEITESMIMHRVEQAIATLRQLHELGVKLSVDDFGTGYSSLSYLKRFPVHNLKIDRSFVRDLHQNADDAAIVRAVIALAQNMHLKTVAEGVETEQQLIFLAGLQCDEYQGYYFSKPVPAVEFLSLLQAQHAAPVLRAGANA